MLQQMQRTTGRDGTAAAPVLRRPAGPGPARPWAAAVVGVLLAVLATSPALALDYGAIPADHQRPLLTAQEEAAWLKELVEASPHYALWQQRPKDEPVAQVAPPPLGPVPMATPSAFAAPKGRRVYGYLPYWTKKTAVIPWGTVTQVAWFSAGIGESGAITSLAGWNTQDAKDFIKLAHSKGAQVTLTFTQFSTAAISKILATAESRQKAVDNIVATVIAGGGDGCNIDFEGLAKADRDKMNAFVQLLSATFAQKLPGADVTLATPAVDWSGAWDYQFLAEHSDGLMIMAYALHWGGGNPGPQLPMKADKPWYHKTLPWIVGDYLTWGKAKNKAKFIVGLPLYGMTWPSSSDKPGAAQLDKGKSVFFSAAQSLASAAGGWKWDPTSDSTYFAVQTAGVWQQTWCDSQKAFEMRVDYLDVQDLPMGLWALGYSDGHPKVAEAIEAWQSKGDTPVPVDPGPEPQPEPQPEAAVDAGGTTADADAAAPVDALVSDLQVGELPSGDASSAEVLSADVKKTDTIWYYEDAVADAAAPGAPDVASFADAVADQAAPRQQGDSSERTPRIADTNAGGGGTVATAVASPADSGCRGAPAAGANPATAAAAGLAVLTLLRRRRAKG